MRYGHERTCHTLVGRTDKGHGRLLDTAYQARKDRQPGKQQMSVLQMLKLKPVDWYIKTEA